MITTNFGMVAAPPPHSMMHHLVRYPSSCDPSRMKASCLHNSAGSSILAARDEYLSTELQSVDANVDQPSSSYT